jgi:hypothetical protein
MRLSGFLLTLVKTQNTTGLFSKDRFHPEIFASRQKKKKDSLASTRAL